MSENPFGPLFSVQRTSVSTFLVQWKSFLSSATAPPGLCCDHMERRSPLQHPSSNVQHHSGVGRESLLQEVLGFALSSTRTTRLTPSVLPSTYPRTGPWAVQSVPPSTTVAFPLKEKRVSLPLGLRDPFDHHVARAALPSRACRQPKTIIPASQGMTTFNQKTVKRQTGSLLTMLREAFGKYVSPIILVRHPGQPAQGLHFRASLPGLQPPFPYGNTLSTLLVRAVTAAGFLPALQDTHQVQNRRPRYDSTVQLWGAADVNGVTPRVGLARGRRCFHSRPPNVACWSKTSPAPSLKGEMSLERRRRLGTISRVFHPATENGLALVSHNDPARVQTSSVAGVERHAGRPSLSFRSRSLQCRCCAASTADIALAARTASGLFAFSCPGEKDVWPRSAGPRL